MSSIHSVGGNLPIQSYTTPSKSLTTPPADSSTNGSDSVELTGVNQYLQILKSNNVRSDKVASIRSQIDSNTYDSDGSKFDAATDRLLEDLNV